MIKHYNAIRSM